MSDDKTPSDSTPDAPSSDPTADVAVPPEPVSEVEATQPLPEPRPAPPPEAVGGQPAATEASVAEVTEADELPDGERPTEEPGAPLVPKQRGRRDLLVDVLAVSTVVLLVATILLGLMAFAPRMAPIKSHATRLAADALESEEITDVAKRFARNFLTIDYRSIDKDIERITADATGDFKSQIGQVLRLSREQFEKRKATSKGKVNEAVLLFNEDDNARVQVLAERTIRNVRTKAREERPETKVLDIALVRTSSGWKVDNVREVEVQSQPGAGR